MGVNDWTLTAGGSRWFDRLNVEPGCIVTAVAGVVLAAVNVALIGEMCERIAVAGGSAALPAAR